MNDCKDRLAAYAHVFERLEPASLDQLETLYSDNATFRDPFNAVQGRAAIRRVFEHMFRTTTAARFEVYEWWCRGQSGCLRWRFTCTLRGRAIDLHGMSHVSLDANGRVSAHVDYWDAAEGVYERLPLIGAVLRRLRRRMRV
jgi:hypothetical protein